MPVAGSLSNIGIGSTSGQISLLTSPLGLLLAGEGVMGAFQDWKREREAIEKEMDRLITAGRPTTADERQVRQLQFTALIERRDAAARDLMQSGNASRRIKSSGSTST
jgi:hypothetical protein